ncbi:hypothetical protein EVAR_38228_1 [Eumeta japonica]|uniref:Uncharacterized protein n=1 Tax=Eumeta variegata TaxID=151549 RepID=A0A4C1XEC0_EUMVA|nr:hypothetical protein EVAR_38228_1 [Eumeta japonica]
MDQSRLAIAGFPVLTQTWPRNSTLGVPHENEQFQQVRHTHTKYRREVPTYAIAFQPLTEISDGPPPSITPLHRPLLAPSGSARADIGSAGAGRPPREAVHPIRKDLLARFNLRYGAAAASPIFSFVPRIIIFILLVPPFEYRFCTRRLARSSSFATGSNTAVVRKARRPTGKTGRCRKACIIHKEVRERRAPRRRYFTYGDVIGKRTPPPARWPARRPPPPPPPPAAAP